MLFPEVIKKKTIKAKNPAIAGFCIIRGQALKSAHLNQELY